MGYRIAPAVKAALTQATELWPRRSKVSDGTIGDPSHSARASDHNPASDGYVYAFDLTHDPGAGCDAHALVREAVARRDSRIKYAISNRRIWSSARAAEGWRPYGGANPHTKHAHVSVHRSHRDDTRPWWPQVTAHTAVDPQPLQEDEMTPQDWTRMEKLVDDRIRLVLRGENSDGKPTGHPNLRDLTDRLTAIENALGSGTDQ